ncbi:MAG TPA: sugar dehydrogenase [Acidiferrobacteraceae bacterium]|nr:sugar dehydrogenase [Acidiferrobacteraceae bacterium]HEX20647.1 sugar dehydrogenase [Acidiferrobacteraceae bacterium]
MPSAQLPFRFYVLILFGLVLLVPFADTAHAIEYHKQAITVGGRTHEVTIPGGFRLELLTARLDVPRLMSFAKNGDLFIGSRSGKVYRLAPPYTKPQVLVELDDYPHSVALRKGEILIARTNGLYRAPYRLGQTKINPDQVTLLAALPGGWGHNSRTVHIGPDRRVYVSLGISGNCSNQYLDNSYRFNDRRGGILVLLEGRGKPFFKTFASGLRNPVGFAWHPLTRIMYASNNGPDHLGFEIPPEYFSQINRGSFHGMPWFQYNGKKIIRDHCLHQKPPRPVNQVVVPVATFPARSAPMGMIFVPRGALNNRYTNDAIVALHGSWGTKPTGGSSGHPATRRHPKLVRVRFHQGKARGVENFITGFQLANGRRWARPVGAAIGPDGALYFTSDAGANALFRLRRDK